MARTISKEKGNEDPKLNMHLIIKTIGKLARITPAPGMGSPLRQFLDIIGDLPNAHTDFLDSKNWKFGTTGMSIFFDILFAGALIWMRKKINAAQNQRHFEIQH